MTKLLLALVSLVVVCGCGHTVKTGVGGSSTASTGNTASGVTSGTGPGSTVASTTGATTTGTGGGCVNNQDCGTAANTWCAHAVTHCPNGNPPPVTVAPTGTCKTTPATCAGPDDCPPSQVCNGGQCDVFPDQCTIAPKTCPAGCTWTRPWPCACVCDTCP